MSAPPATIDYQCYSRPAFFSYAPKDLPLDSGDSAVLDMTMFPEGTAEHLRDEAKQRGLSLAEVYREELKYQTLSRERALTQEELKALALKSQPNLRLLEGDESCPF